MIHDKHGPVISIRKGVHYLEQEIVLTPGAKIFLYTDGVPEAHNAAGEMFREERIVLALNEGYEKPPEELLQHMRKAVDAFVQDAPQFDDLTMLCLEYKGTVAS
jgi:serine phosphatase RsbU (regulator of sigma subunit)